MAPQKTRIRLVSSRGHLYAQEVRYEWDRIRQRGITHVIRTLGPMAPLRKATVGGLDTGEIWLRLKLQREERSKARRLPPSYRTKAAVPAASADQTFAAEETGKRATEVPAGRRSLTGSLGLESLDQKVLQCVRQQGGQATRAGVFEALRAAGIARPNHHQSLRRHVSFALTRLFRREQVARTGSGGKGDPFRYHSLP